MLFGRVSRKMITTGTSNGTGFYGQMKPKNELFSSKLSRWVWWTRIKSTPCAQWNILLYFWCCGPRFLLVLDNLFMALFHCMVRHGTARYGSLLGGFPLGTVPGTWYFFSTTSVEVPSEPYRYQNVTCKLCWSLIGRRKSSLLRHWTCDTRPSSTVLPARFKSAQPAKDRTQLLFKQTHIFASSTK